MRHWTDVAPSPAFETVIDARGPSGNVFEILGKARVLMRQLHVPPDRIDELSLKVMNAKTYDEAIGHVERWFKVER